MRPQLTQGLVQVYTGNSKGKTTASLGLALRAIGHGFRVYIIQFMKGSTYYGELFSVQRLYPEIQIAQYGRNCQFDSMIRQGEMTCTGCGHCFVRKGEATEQDRAGAQFAMQRAREVMASGEFDLVILDELSNALYFELITLEEALDLIRSKPEKVELIITGRNAPQEIQDAAHLVTEMREIKHPYQIGVPSRRGIEY
ncbi:cob(I)yrinic acid a,c-diamide adenosyltransferase [Heliophilum fasciatum]|uniref:Cob(I)yrinic acid a,c-diamide adenosyltransferase n=1 Tax=Heliophilum fasciatum TaxID=35700 RepID=A0A4R2RNC7_9FIRM|nr:cob(I)yrinic acid a,c-diamide adenosyltransferase [Heliophilum fasciatum]MCW2278319.1 cob(I)alamin adenosyltransferase [Heliophilum fasciatum]TCP63807.1 cob(I)yrinic acid a,c-diamide adenosyltransferase [Heliophilum fasciatum]